MMSGSRLAPHKHNPFTHYVEASTTYTGPVFGCLHSDRHFLMSGLKNKLQEWPLEETPRLEPISNRMASTNRRGEMPSIKQRQRNRIEHHWAMQHPVQTQGGMIPQSQLPRWTRTILAPHLVSIHRVLLYLPTLPILAIYHVNIYARIFFHWHAIFVSQNMLAYIFTW